jgi:selenocysteine lyase/cysteine desulfurase
VKLIQSPWPELLQQIGPRTRLVAVSLMSYVDGFLAPVDQIAEACRRTGALFYVDGTQGIGALQFDFANLQPDVLAVDTYKWMLTPNGISFFAVSPRLRAQMQPLTVGWRSDRDWRNVANLHHGAPRFVEAAEKYEGGMLPTMQLYALDAVVEMMLEIGPAAIETRILELAAQSRSILERHGGVVAHPDSPIQAAAFEGKDAPALAAALKERGILASARHGRLRVSTHFYNDESDLQALNRALTR